MVPLETHVQAKIRPINAEFNCSITSDSSTFNSESGKDLNNLTQNDFIVIDDYLYFEDWVMNKGGTCYITITDSSGNIYNDSDQLYEGGDGLIFEFTLSNAPPVTSNPQISKIQTPDGTIYDIVASNGYTKDEIDAMFEDIETLLSEV